MSNNMKLILKECLILLRNIFNLDSLKLKMPQLHRRVRFEAISVGVALALREYPDLEVENVDWLNSNDFKVLTTSDASNNEGKLVARVEYVRDKLIGAKVNDCDT